MNPRIDGTAFGSITVSGRRYDHDVVIRLDGIVQRRCKAVSGTSHELSSAEAERLVEGGAERVIVGSGQHGVLNVCEEASSCLAKKGCSVDIFPTPRAIEVWNSAEGAVVGLFHVTC